ncbi:BUD13 homolog, partial [Saccoglossus kowalevskii]|uniref:BUD13 homolog n=1 Tax=Saccoglossus kowalevskii TaxID=10224 RepID=A0ABM0MW94_SACKO
MAALSKEEYLKRYLESGDNESTKKKKKKKTKPSIKRSGVLIVDDDINIQSIAPKIEDIEEAPFLDEAPQVAGMTDDRPEDIIVIEKYRSDGRWKTMGEDKKPSIAVQDSGSDDDLPLPKRKPTRHDSDSDLSPPRIRLDSDSDLSPPRSNSQKRLQSCKNNNSDNWDSDQSPPRKSKPSKTLSGNRAGLSDAATLRRENDQRRQRDNQTFDNLSAEISGRNAETVFRDKGGRKRNLKTEKIKQREEEAKKAEEAEQYMQWGKGVVQSKERQSTVEENLYEMSKPLARFKDDVDLDAMLKEKDRDEDPMLAFVKKKRAKQALKAGIK